MNCLSPKSKHFKAALALILASASLIASVGPLARPAMAVETWEHLDKRLKTQVFEINVAIKFKLKDNIYCQIADATPNSHQYVFSAATTDPGFRVIQMATAFPIKTKHSDKTYFLTARHVFDSTDSLVGSFEHFYAAMRLYAEQTATNNNVDERYRELLQIVNIATKKDRSKAMLITYQTTVENIWSTYETYLSPRPDPGHARLDKYIKITGADAQVGYFLHPSGSVNQQPLLAKVYKASKPDTDPDIAVLVADKAQTIPLELDPLESSEGQEVQVIGYPIASDQIDNEANEYFTPTFSNGHVTKVTPHLVQVDAPITKGNSGGPVINLRGKVCGLVVRRALTDSGAELNKFGAAMSVQQIKEFAPDLF